MTLRRLTASALVLLLAAPTLHVGTADAAFIRRVVVSDTVYWQAGTLSTSSRVVVTADADSAAAGYEVEVESEAGDETVTLTETDTWLHGSATIAALPTSTATLTLTVYDELNVPLASFAGTLDADGRLTMGDASAVSADDTSGCASRSGCGTSDATGKGDAADLEVRSARYSNHAFGSAIDVYLAGADAWSASSASLTVTESVAGEEVCYAYDADGNCLKWGSTTTTVRAESELDFDDLGSVWEGTLDTAPEGEVTLKVESQDARGKKIEKTKVKVGLPWEDGGAGIATVSTDEDPLTRVGLYDWIDTGFNQTFQSAGDRRGYGQGKYGLELDGIGAGWVAHSEGWTYGDDVPVSAELELTSGEEVTVPVNSYQRRVKPEFYCEDIRFEYGTGATFGKILINGSTLTVDTGSVSLADESAFRKSAGDTRRAVLTVEDLEAPVCAGGTCVQLAADDAGEVCSLAVTQYAAALPFADDGVEIELVATDDEGNELGSTVLTPEFDDELTVVFGVDLAFTGNPVGQSLSGKLSLLGEADKKGKQPTLAKGKFYAMATIGESGFLELAGIDKDDAGDLDEASVIAGEALELTGDLGDNTLAPPLAATCGNGSGTKAASSQTSTRPQLL